MSDIENILDLCLEKIRTGVPLDKVLAEYPEQAAELKPLLLVAARVEAAPRPEPGADAAYPALLQVLKHLPGRGGPGVLSWWNRLFRPQFVFARAMSLVLIFALLSWSAVGVSANTLPGDLLYPVKLAAEQVQFALTVRPEGKAELRLTFSEQRMREVLARYRRDGTVDATLLKEMLDEAKLAIDRVASLPKEKQALFYSKVLHFNDYQKETLQSLQGRVSGEQRKYVDEAIEDCSSRGEWMRNMEGKGMGCPWDESSGSDWR